MAELEEHPTAKQLRKQRAAEDSTRNSSSECCLASQNCAWMSA